MGADLNDARFSRTVEFGIGGSPCACVTSEASFWQAAPTAEGSRGETAAGNVLVREAVSAPKAVTTARFSATHFAVPATPLATPVVDVDGATQG